MKIHAVILITLSLLYSIGGSALATEFGPDSATITNRYLPMKVNERHIEFGYGNLEGKTTYWDVVGIETVETVRCLKVNRISTKEDNFVTLWFAQDIGGNVWVLKAYVHHEDRTLLLGNGIEHWFMPAAPAVGLNAGLIAPASDETYSKIVATGVTVPKLSTGLGPFEDCLEVKCWWEGSPNEDVEYYCPNVGGVRITEGNPENNAGMDLKANFSTGSPGDVNSDGKLGLEDTVYILQVLSGSRPQ